MEEEAKPFLSPSRFDSNSHREGGHVGERPDCLGDTGLKNPSLPVIQMLYQWLHLNDCLFVPATLAGAWGLTHFQGPQRAEQPGSPEQPQAHSAVGSRLGRKGAKEHGFCPVAPTNLNFIEAVPRDGRSFGLEGALTLCILFSLFALLLQPQEEARQVPPPPPLTYSQTHTYTHIHTHTHTEPSASQFRV
jgi:hypothetical protein